jgi:hypothetical protein
LIHADLLKSENLFCGKQKELDWDRDQSAACAIVVEVIGQALSVAAQSRWKCSKDLVMKDIRSTAGLACQFI